MCRTRYGLAVSIVIPVSGSQVLEAAKMGKEHALLIALMNELKVEKLSGDNQYMCAVCDKKVFLDVI